MKKFLSLLLAAMMILSVMPMTALADGMKSLDLSPIGEVSAPADEPAAEPEQQPAEEPAEPEQEQEQPAEEPAAEPNDALDAVETQESKVVGKVWIGFTNSTWTKGTEASDGIKPAWSGLKSAEPVDLKEDSTMMSVIVDMCKLRGWEIIGADEGYIRSINGVAEFGNGPQSGWMGTLNGWFTNKGFDKYSVADGTLKDGDEIMLMYTSTGYGKDIGGDWETGDKTITTLQTNSNDGELMPAFSPDIHEYKFLLKDGVSETLMVPTASNKQFQVHMYIGDTEYAVTSNTNVPAVPGTELVIKCGDPSWESAAPNSGKAQVYTIKFVSTGEMLNENSVSVKTIKEDGKSEGEEATVSYNSEKGTFTATTVRSFTHLTQYNDIGFTVTVSGLPEGASAELFADDGSKVADFIDGKVTINDALKTIGNHNYSISVKKGDVEEVYKLIVVKSPNTKMDYNKVLGMFTGKPSFNKENIFNGQPEGTLFQADMEGNLTGGVGYDENCWSYVMYVSPDVASVVPKILQVNDSKIRNNSTTSFYVNGNLKTEQKSMTLAVNVWKNSPITLESGVNEFELVMKYRTDPTVELHFKLFVDVVRVTPEELIEKIKSLPEPNDLTYENDYGILTNYSKAYEGLSDEEKAQIPADLVKKLQDCVARMEVLKERFDKGVNELSDLVTSVAGKITGDNYLNYIDDVRKSVELYLGLSDGQRTAFKGAMYEGSSMLDVFWQNYNAAILPSIKNGDSIGYPTDYPDDFIIQSGYYNLDLGHEDTYYQTGFREIWTNRPKTYYQYNEKGLPFTSPGLLEFEIKDESIFEIKEVESVYTDMGLGGHGEHANMLYYLVPKKAGTTTFTVKMRDEAGVMYCQTPEIVVHVNSPEESATEKLYQKLTDFTEREYTRRYDNWTYEYGQPGAKFSFHINGTNGKVWVYNYLEYNADGTPVKTEYTPDANGDVTILLKDGYNCIEVNADYEGNNVTQVYSLKGKVTQNVVENISRPGEPLRKGDNAGVWIIGRPICLHKILRIYNNGNGATQYLSNMPRQGLIKTDSAILINYIGFVGCETNAFQRLFVPLTDSGDIVLYNGYIRHTGYGSGLGSELTQGNTGGMADSTQFKFGQLANITIKGVEDNPNYVEPETMKTEISSTVVKAGETVTITVPELPTEKISHDYDQNEQNKIRYATTRFYTDIPGMETVEASYKRPDQNLDEGVPTVNDIKTITITIPEDTPAGVYNFHGGNVELAYTLGWMDYYSNLYCGQIDDVSLTVLPSDATAVRNVENLINAIGTVTKDSGNAIKAAREAYDALTPEQKELVSKEVYDTLVKAEKAYSMIVDSNKPDASDKGDKTGSIIKISATGAAKGEENPNTGAPAMSIAPAVLVLAAAAFVLKKRG